MKKKLLQLKKITLIFALLLISTFFLHLFAQSTGDFQSNATGNWTTLASWQYYNGSTWVTPSGVSPQGYPGQFTGTGTVTIQSAHTITINSVINTQNFGTLTVLGILQLTGSSSGITFTLNTLNLIDQGNGAINFLNKATLALPVNAALSTDALGLTGDCSANQEIKIGSIVFATCQGGSGDKYTFAQLMTSGGTLNATPTSNSPICQGSTINLTGNYGGAIGTLPAYSWNITAPGGGVTTYNTKDVSISSAVIGTYTAVLTVTTILGGTTHTNSETISVLVRTPSTAPTSITGTTTICSGSTTTLTAAGGTMGTNATYEWGTGSTVGSNIIPGATSINYTTIALTSNTIYWVRRVDPAPCSTFTGGVTVTVTVNTPSTAPTSITGILRICSGSTTTLTAAGGTTGTNATYEWGTGSTVGLNIIGGATTVSYTTLVLNSTTTYWVRRVDPAPCNTTTTGVTATVLVSNTDVLTWNGSVNNNWHTSANWTPNYVPLLCDNVTIPTSLTNYPTIAAAAFCNNLTIESGATILGNLNLTVGGSNTVNQNLSSYRSWYLTASVSPTITPVPNTGSLTIYQYLESANNDETANISWLPSTTLLPNKGYFVTPSSAGTTNIAFSGALNDGNISFPVTRNDHIGKLKNGYNLVGNPYQSYLDWTVLSGANSSLMPTATMWYRTKVSGVYYFWTVNGSGIGTPALASKNIPPMQAFWIRTLAGGGSLNMTNAMRLHEVSGSNLLKAPAIKMAVNQILRLQVSSGVTTDETVIYFNVNAANGFDTFDSPKMINGTSSSTPDIYTLVNEELALNGMNSIPYVTEIPLYFKANSSVGTSFTINANEFSNFEPGTQVWIKNNLSGIYQLISDGTPYTFDITETGTNPKFNISFKAPGVTTGFKNTNKRNILIFGNADNQITVTCNGEIDKYATFSVYNNIGQMIAKKPLLGNVTVIEKPMKTGIYIVTVNNAGSSTTDRVIIK